MPFLTWFQHLVTLKINDKKYVERFAETVLYTMLHKISRKVDSQGVCFLTKDPDSEPGDPKRLDPTGSGSATLLLSDSSVQDIVL